MTLASLRERLEAVDDALVALLAERAALVGEVWAFKAAHDLPRTDPAREAAETARLLERAAALGLDRDAVGAVLAAIIGRELRDGA